MCTFSHPSNWFLLALQMNKNYLVSVISEEIQQTCNIMFWNNNLTPPCVRFEICICCGRRKMSIILGSGRSLPTMKLTFVAPQSCFVTPPPVICVYFHIMSVPFNYSGSIPWFRFLFRDVSRFESIQSGLRSCCVVLLIH